MKILFYIDSLRSGGKERRFVELIKGLRSFPEIDIEIVLTKKKIHYQEILKLGVKIYYTQRREGVKKDPLVFKSFYEIAKDFNPDIIHVWSNLTAIYAIPAKVILRTHMINNQITNATHQKSFSILSHRLSFKFSDRIVANTYAGLRAYKSPKAKSSVIHNGFDFKRIDQLDDKDHILKKFKIKTKNVVGMVASFNEKKDYETFIKAANIILRSNKNITFLCVGSGDYSGYERMVPEYNRDRILFLGKQRDVESIMNVCNIGVLLTNDNHGEGISNALMEFMALGKPVIATNNGGTPEIVKHNISGFLIDSHSVDNLVDKITFFLKNEKELVEFGQASKLIIKKHFSINKMIKDFTSLYNKVLINGKV